MPSSTSKISAIGVALPSLRLPVEVLAEHLSVDPNKYKIGLGCVAQSLCGPDDSPVRLGIRAAELALEQWGGDISQIGMLAVGTETALDMSRPLGAWMAEALNLPESVRSYEVKHACYAGTLALRQAFEWQRSGASRGKAALVICADEALYAPGHPGEPTQGAAAVAMILDAEGFAEIGLHSYAFQRPAFDFWRPVGEAYPQVDGPLSIRCYQDAFSSCLEQWAEDSEATFALDAVDAWAMHAPFPKMVLKGFIAGQQAAGVDEELAQQRYSEQVLPSLAWNTRVGNCYTASAWLAFACAAASSDSAKNIALFSYGSGCGAELVLLQQTAPVSTRLKASVEAQLAAQTVLSVDDYIALRSHR